MRLPIRDESDVVMARRHGRDMAVRVGCPENAVASLATAISEVARNIVEHAASGEVVLAMIGEGSRRGVMVIARDNGPGMAEPSLAMRDGYSTKRGLGLGLASAQRLMDEFEIESVVGKGTTVTMKKWGA